MVILQPGKRWDARDQCESRRPTSGTASGQTPEETWDTREMSVRYPLDEIVAEVTRRWMSTVEPRPWHINRSIDNATLPVSEFSREIEELRKDIQDLRASNAALQARVSTLERKLTREAAADDLWDISDDNLATLEELLGIPTPISGLPEEDPFGALKGLLSEYSDETVDSVELVDAVRGK